MRFKLPHPLVLLLGGVVVAVVLTWILPAGRYQRRTDPETGREVVPEPTDGSRPRRSARWGRS